MNKSSNVKRIHVKEENAKKAPAIDLKVQSVDLQEVVRMGLRDFMMEVGMMAVRQTMEAEVEKLAGLRYVRDPENDKSRWGTQQGLVYVNGQKVNIQRPRVVKKSAGRHTEVELETYRAFSNPDAMNEAVMAKVVAGVSTRDYEKTLEHVLDGHGVSRSAVSRRAVKESGKLRATTCNTKAA